MASILEIACGSGYWPQFLAPVASFIAKRNAALEPGAKLVFLDNRFVAGYWAFEYCVPAA